MEVVREQPPIGERHHTSNYSRLILGETDPHPLLVARSALRHARRGDSRPIEAFPQFNRVRAGSPAYVDEDLWITSKEASELLSEFSRLRRACAREDFVAGLDAIATWSAWQDGMPESEFKLWIDHIERLLRKAAEGGWWVRLML
jgi:hypothetical protein